MSSPAGAVRLTAALVIVISQANRLAKMQAAIFYKLLLQTLFINCSYEPFTNRFNKRFLQTTSLQVKDGLLIKDATIESNKQ
jgi:hypothetical protein